MTLTEIRRLLDELGARPKRRFGQNFMFDQNLVRRIVEIAQIKAGSPVIEIGPGLGALTDYLIEQKPKLTLIEHDHVFIPHLESRFPNATIIQGDALKLISNCQLKISDFLIIGNLPYSIASTLMIRLCEPSLRPKRMVFTIQLEVAERLVARIDTKDFGLLTLLTQPFYEIDLLRKVPPSVFWPAPEVESAVIIMNRKEKQPFETLEQDIAFREISKKAFQKRRKTLGAIFGKELPSTLDRSKRPENLTILEWIDFARSKAIDTEEFFDVVDEKDEIISQQPRSKVHRTKLLHRAVHILIWNKKGELLLQKRSPWKDVSPNTWDSSAAGHLGVGEDYDVAAQREVKEELGIEIPIDRIQRFSACVELGWEFVWLYRGESEGKFRFPESEIAEVRWWETSEIDKAIKERPLEFAGSFRFIWNHFKLKESKS